MPGEGADLQVWILGSSGGESAAGRRAAAGCGSRRTTTSARPRCWRRWRATGPRSSRPTHLDKPYVSVSADVVVAEDDATARELATGYGLWVRSIRTAEGAIPFPTPEEARAHPWTRGGPGAGARTASTPSSSARPRQVADQLERLRDATGADELLITTITHDHADRVRSYELLAEEWRRRGHTLGPR